MHEMMEKLFELLQTPWGVWALVAHAFLESFIMPIPHDLFLITISLAQPDKAIFFALLSTTASTLGNMVGYSIGKFGGQPLLNRVVHKDLLAGAKKLIDKYDGWATFVACFTPFPDKVFGLCAGAFGINFPKFVLIIFIARGCRFFLVSGLLYFYGDAVHNFILEKMDTMMILIVVFIVAGYVGLKLTNRFLKRQNPGDNPSSQP